MTEVVLLNRKNNRLKGFDYSTPGAYFITICTVERKNLFWKSDKNVGTANGRPNDAPLNECGMVVRQKIEEIERHYPMISVDH